jgi:hypothetical protein
MRMKSWNIDWAVRNTVRKLRGETSLEAERQERMAMLREMLHPGETTHVKPGLTAAYFGKLARDFALSSVSLTKRNGSMLASSAKKDASTESRVFDSVSSQLPGAKYLLIKCENKTHVIYPDNGSLLIVEAAGNVSPIEMKALLRKVRGRDNS